jgi:type IV pilus assembly protein PilV
MVKTFTKNQLGFTLIEVLVSLVIFSVGILAVNAMQTTSIIGNSKARGYSEAANAAAATMERLLSLDFSAADLDDDDGADDGIEDGDGTAQDTLIPLDGVDDDGGNYGLDDLKNPDGTELSADGRYTVFWNIANDLPRTSNTLNESVKTIRVHATWNERGETKTVTITNIKAAE